MLVLKAWHSPLLKHIVILNKMARYGHLAIDYIEQGSSLLLKMILRVSTMLTLLVDVTE